MLRTAGNSGGTQNQEQQAGNHANRHGEAAAYTVGPVVESGAVASTSPSLYTKQKRNGTATVPPIRARARIRAHRRENPWKAEKQPARRGRTTGKLLHRQPCERAAASQKSKQVELRACPLSRIFYSARFFLQIYAKEGTDEGKSPACGSHQQQQHPRREKNSPHTKRMPRAASAALQREDQCSRRGRPCNAATLLFHALRPRARPNYRAERWWLRHASSLCPDSTARSGLSGGTRTSGPPTGRL